MDTLLEETQKHKRSIIFAIRTNPYYSGLKISLVNEKNNAAMLLYLCR